jgi:hypothetical protein
MSAAVALCSVIACSDAPVENIDAAQRASSPEAFTGVWRSVTPSLEFVRLTVDSKSSEIGVLAGRLTFSGVAWDGQGRVQGDSLVLHMGMSGSATANAVLVGRFREGRSLIVQLRAGEAVPLDLSFVRDE